MNQVQQDIRKAFVLKHMLAGFDDDAIARAWNADHAENGTALAITPASVRVDRLRIMGDMADTYTQDVEAWRTMLIARSEQVFRVIWNMFESGHLGAVEKWLETIKVQAQLVGANAPTKVHGTYEHTHTYTDDEQRARAIAELIKRVKEKRDGMRIEHPPHVVIDVTPQQHE